MLISVVVGATRAGMLSILVESLRHQEHSCWELIVVTQGTDPALQAEAAQLEARSNRVRAIHLEGYGKSRALNVGVRAAEGEIFAFTDDDCEADRLWLSTIASCFEAEPDVGIVAGNVVAPPAPRLTISTCPSADVLEYIYWPAACGYQAPPGFYFIGANYALRRSTFESIGPFDEYFGPGGLFPAAEETDLGLRAEAQDIGMWTTPCSTVYHTYGRRSGLSAVLKHHRNYARSKGALIGKLELWGHRLAKEWSREPNLSEKLSTLVKNPGRLFLNQYLAGLVAEGKREYLANFTLGSGQLSVPKSAVSSLHSD